MARLSTRGIHCRGTACTMARIPIFTASGRLSHPACRSSCPLCCRGESGVPLPLAGGHAPKAPALFPTHAMIEEHRQNRPNVFACARVRRRALRRRRACASRNADMMPSCTFAVGRYMPLMQLWSTAWRAQRDSNKDHTAKNVRGMAEPGVSPRPYGVHDYNALRCSRRIRCREGDTLRPPARPQG